MEVTLKIMKINLSGNLLEKNLQKSWNYVILKSENPGYYTNVKDYARTCTLCVRLHIHHVYGTIV